MDDEILLEVEGADEVVVYPDAYIPDHSITRDKFAYTAAFVGASADSSGQAGIVPQPLVNQQDRLLYGDAQWSQTWLDTTQGDDGGLTLTLGRYVEDGWAIESRPISQVTVTPTYTVTDGDLTISLT